MTITAAISLTKGRVLEAYLNTGRDCGARARICSPRPGGPGIMPAGTRTGARGASLQPAAARAAKPAAFRAAFGKPGPELSPRDESPAGKNRKWNAGRRARPQAEGGASRHLFVARTARRLRAGMRHCVCRRSASLYFLLRSPD